MKFEFTCAVYYFSLVLSVSPSYYGTRHLNMFNRVSHISFRSGKYGSLAEVPAVSNDDIEWCIFIGAIRRQEAAGGCTRTSNRSTSHRVSPCAANHHTKLTYCFSLSQVQAHSLLSDQLCRFTIVRYSRFQSLKLCRLDVSP